VKVIFIEDVPDMALAGETKEVADGYGRNYLLPRKLAVLANSQGAAVLESQLKKITAKRAQAEQEMTETAGKLDGMEFTIKAKAGEKERLYGSITSADIASEISSSAGLDVDKRKIELEEPIRQIGSYEVSIRFAHDITAVVKLTVVADEVAEEKEEKKARKRKAKAEKEEAEEAEEKAEEAEGKLEEPEGKVEEVEEKVEEVEEAEETEEAKPGE